MVSTKTILSVTLILAFSYLFGCATTYKNKASDPLYNDLIRWDLDKVPEVVCWSKPRYPAKAVKQGIQGKAIVAVTVAQDGSVLGVELYKSSGDRDLDLSAMEAAKKCKFRPAMKNGEAIQSTVTMPFDFRIR